MCNCNSCGNCCGCNTTRSTCGCNTCGTTRSTCGCNTCGCDIGSVFSGCFGDWSNTLFPTFTISTGRSGNCGCNTCSRDTKSASCGTSLVEQLARLTDAIATPCCKSDSCSSCR